MANIQQLAPELLIQILSLVQTLEDLRSLVFASSACFRTYSSYKRPIVLSVLAHVLSPELLRELFAISNIPRLEVGDDSNSSRVHAFYEQYFSDQPFELPLDPTDANILSLLRTYFTVERLIPIYFQHAYAPFLYVDRSQHPDEERPRFIPLSAAEKGRLQRAFYRYEQYSRVFTQAPFESELPRLQCVEFWQYDRVISRMTPFEVEELACIHLFLVTITGGFVEDLEDDVFDAVVSCPGVRGVAGPGPDRGSLEDADKVEAYGPRRVKLSRSCNRKRIRSPSPTPIYPSRYRPSDDTPPEGYLSFSSASLNRYDLAMFRSGYPQRLRPKFVGKLASLGLDFVLQLIDAPSASHRRSPIQSRRLAGLAFLPDAVDSLWQEMIDNASQGYNPDAPLPEPRRIFVPREIDVRDGPTPDQQRLPQNLFYNRGPREVGCLEIYNSIGDIRWDRLRAIGYLFWDKARLEGPAAQRTLIMSWNVSSCSYREPVQEIHRWFSKRKSVEERLRGVSIPAEDMVRIAKEFGCPSY